MKVNGEERPLNADTIAALLAAIGLDPEKPGIAVALNGAVVRRAEWSAQGITADDEIEVIRPVTGG